MAFDILMWLNFDYDYKCNGVKVFGLTFCWLTQPQSQKQPVQHYVYSPTQFYKPPIWILNESSIAAILPTSLKALNPLPI